MQTLSIRYHRNGTAGQGFFAVDFLANVDGELRHMHAIYCTLGDDEEGVNYAQCYVTDAVDLTLRYRGDNFATEIDAACRKASVDHNGPAFREGVVG